jgi:hypothetical protein
MSTQNNDTTAGWIIFGTVVAALCAGVLWLLPQVGAYYSQVGGRGALLKAESTRQVRVLEAKAKLEAADLEARAEVRRAQGSAQAIEAIKGQLGGPEGYLRWLYIQGLQENTASSNNGGEGGGGGGGHKETIVYIPTDGLVPLPISEAGRVAR